MSFIEIAKNRYSCRTFKNTPVEDHQLRQVLEAGRTAPSAKNLQPWHFIVIQDNEILNQIKAMYGQKWLETAPLIIAVCGDHTSGWRRPDGKDHTDIDIAIATDHMTLAATDLGLATCWVCMFDAMKCSQLLQLPEGIEPMVLLPLGYPADEVNPERHQTKRQNLEQMVHTNQFTRR